MITGRLAPPAETTPAVSSPAAGLRQAFACLWWLVRAHMADVHLMPRNDALEPPPARWLRGWPRR
jgi:hypothetical protein